MLRDCNVVSLASEAHSSVGEHFPCSRMPVTVSVRSCSSLCDVVEAELLEV
eukprot:COSAG06_NODE_45018_length_358_cov_0.930502_1_plen_50_part_10